MGLRDGGAHAWCWVKCCSVAASKRPLIDLAYTLASAGTYAEAEQLLIEVIDDPDVSAVNRFVGLQNVGLCKLRSGRWSEACLALVASVQGLTAPGSRRERAFSLA